MIREFTSSDDIEALTHLLHRAYSIHATRGIRFFASHQSPNDTANRISKGRCFILEEKNQLIGTVTIYGFNKKAEVECYRNKGTFHFSQFAVDPDYKGRGYGRILHSKIIEYALSLGGSALAIDTASPATDLVAMYKRWGYEEVGRHRWSATNYESIVMKYEIKKTIGIGQSITEHPLLTTFARILKWRFG
jgi:GNAT superfamily N-acetyltransferase